MPFKTSEVRELQRYVSQIVQARREDHNLGTFVLRNSIRNQLVQKFPNGLDDCIAVATVLVDELLEPVHGDDTRLLVSRTLKCLRD